MSRNLTVETAEMWTVFRSDNCSSHWRKKLSSSYRSLPILKWRAKNQRLIYEVKRLIWVTVLWWTTPANFRVCLRFCALGLSTLCIRPWRSALRIRPWHLSFAFDLGICPSHSLLAFNSLHSTLAFVLRIRSWHSTLCIRPWHLPFAFALGIQLFAFNLDIRPPQHQ